MRGAEINRSGGLSAEFAPDPRDYLTEVAVAMPADKASNRKLRAAIPASQAASLQNAVGPVGKHVA